MDTSMLVALIAPASALAGGSLAWTATYTTEKAAWRRGWRARWDERRLQAYFDYGIAVKREVHLCMRIAENHDLGTKDAGALTPDEGLSALYEAEQRRADLFEALLLLADATVIKAARGWQEAVWKLHAPVNGKRTVDQPTFMALYRDAGVARDDFYVAARASLAVTTPFDLSHEYIEPEVI